MQKLKCFPMIAYRHKHCRSGLQLQIQLPTLNQWIVIYGIVHVTWRSKLKNKNCSTLMLIRIENYICHSETQLYVFNTMSS